MSIKPGEGWTSKRNSEPPISIVVVGGCNQREQVTAALRALQAQQEFYPSSELILVDHASLDNTRQHVQERFPGVRVVSAPAALTRQKASALGTVVANGVVVAVVDCTAPVEPDMFRRLADAYLRAIDNAPQQVIFSLPATAPMLHQPAA